MRGRGEIGSTCAAVTVSGADGETVDFSDQLHLVCSPVSLAIFRSQWAGVAGSPGLSKRITSRAGRPLSSGPDPLRIRVDYRARSLLGAS